MKKKAILVILDGWGLGQIKEADAIQAANTPVMDNLYDKYPHSILVTHGIDVGLPAGQMGNSEVGHLNIGAGRIVFQELARINNSIQDNTLHQETTIQNLILYCKREKKPLHLTGLLSDGGVHSHINHLLALIDIFEKEGIEMNLHLFLDGRDTDPKHGIKYLKTVLNHIKNKDATLASVIGRYFAMDRDLRWERTRKAYYLMVNGVGIQTDNIIETIHREYRNGITDEFMIPIILDESRTIEPNDAVLFYNFRTDRPRQLTRVLTQEDFPEHNMNRLNLHFVTMAKYAESFQNITAVFEKGLIPNTIGDVISQIGLNQVRIAETEKYPHVTYFFSGGKETELEGEKRLLIPSPKVATYDFQPEMSAPELTHSIIEEIMSNGPEFICLNYANADMVGHTGNFKAAVIAVETVDKCLGDLVGIALEEDYELIIIADHGNSDYMINNDGTPNTAHTTNPVPIIHVSNETKNALRDGILADVAPTILEIMVIGQPREMTGKSLIVSIN